MAPEHDSCDRPGQQNHRRSHASESKLTPPSLVQIRAITRERIKTHPTKSAQNQGRAIAS
ncbi:MAG: hypothetical protein SAL70_38045 [Scytonema sp. PMC 1070.18]|nr:hypothetical protein [Scytonema sp. PMC 1070.18]